MIHDITPEQINAISSLFTIDEMKYLNQKYEILYSDIIKYNKKREEILTPLVNAIDDFQNRKKGAAYFVKREYIETRGMTLAYIMTTDKNAYSLEIIRLIQDIISGNYQTTMDLTIKYHGL